MSQLFYRRVMEVAEIGDRESLRRQLAWISEEMGFGLFTVILMQGRPGWPWRSFILGNIPAEWDAASMDSQSSRRDPFLQRSRRLSVPLAYDQSFYVGEGCGDLWEEQAMHGYKTGIGSAVHRDDKHTMVGFDRAEPLPNDEAKRARMLADLQFLSVHAHEAVVRALLPQEAAKVRLTDRQLDVLRWIAQGKTAWATGQILGVSERTVNGHLSAIYAKLDAGSQTQAVFNAVKLGLL
jgi:DNA-binding CsgD family transcriptional regulator